MPDRIIRDRARRSRTLQQLSDAAERAWWRFTVVCDDYGRFEADPEVLLSACFERKPSGWTEKKMQAVIREWVAAALVHLYRIVDDPATYLHAATFHDHQRKRDSKPKFPDPPCGNSPQLAAKCRDSLPLAAYSESRESLSTERRETNNTSPRLSAGGAVADPSLNGWGTPEALKLLYNELTPDELPAVKILSPARIAKCKKYLAMFPERAWWVETFEQIKASLFLRGLKPGKGHEHFKADFDWLLSKGKDGTENALKVNEGKYLGDN
jgi:hypothetical protein